VINADLNSLPFADDGQQPADVSVILCTYNGARYLPAMLESISLQSMRVDRLVHRDDGSSDESVDIVRRWAAHNGVRLHTLDNRSTRLGPSMSFLTALTQSAPARWHFLADQDDVWLPFKIERAVEAIGAASSDPVLYASRLRVVDQSLGALRDTPKPKQLSLSSAVCESLLTGCTMALNEPMRILVARGGAAPEAAMHDWWLYLLAAAFGTIEFDVEPTVLYRQHADNALGAEVRGLTLSWQRFRRFAAGDRGVRSRQLRALHNRYAATLPSGAGELIESLLPPEGEFIARCRAAIGADIERQHWRDTIATRLTILTNRF
jgi:glycosyltransferase involved in cell wall biosynthesis